MKESSIMVRQQNFTTAILFSAAAAATAASAYIYYMRSLSRRTSITSLAELHQAVNSARVLEYMLGQEYAVRIQRTGKDEAELLEIPVQDLLRLSVVLELGLPGHRIAQLQPQACQLRSLRSLDLSGNKLTMLPPEINGLGCLEDLNLGRNCIVRLPAEIGGLQKLRLLNLMANHLVSLPQEICNLTRLYRLGLKGNQLTHLPDNFGNLSSLVELFITGMRPALEYKSGARTIIDSDHEEKQDMELPCTSARSKVYQDACSRHLLKPDVVSADLSWQHIMRG